MKKQELIQQMRSARTTLDMLLAEIGEERMLVPGADGDYSVKDVIAHLAAYEHWTTDWLDAALRGEVLPKGLINDPDLDRRNAALYQQSRHRDLVDVLEDFWQGFERLVEKIEALPDDDLEDAQRTEWFVQPFFDDVPPLWECIWFETGDHYQEHLPALERWCSRR